MGIGCSFLLLCSSVRAEPGSAPAEHRSWRVGNQVWTRSGSCIVVAVDPATIPSQPEQRAAPHHLLYINRCAGGETYTSSWSDDSRSNQSQIIPGTRNMAEFPYSGDSWNEMMQRIRQIYAPFDIEITDVDPGSEPHAEVAVCGSAADWGAENGVLGISPWNCSVIPNSVSFVFPVDHGDDPIGLAESITHEAGHAFTLEHEMICDDIMWWSSECQGDKYFYDQSAQCGDGSATNCHCGSSQQNSYQDLLGNFGAGSPEAPVVTITAPLANEPVNPGFFVRCTVEDAYESIEHVDLYVDGANITSMVGGPYIFNAPNDLADGDHLVEVRAYNMFDVMGSDSVTVFVGAPCGGPGDCDDGEICLDGRCVAGPGTPGGLGEACEDNSECVSGLCGDDTIVKICTEPCDPTADGCPSGFDCTAAGNRDVCWPSEGGGGGCGCRTGERPGGFPGALALLAILTLVGLGGRRRRRG